MWKVLALSLLLLPGSELNLHVRVAPSVGLPAPAASGALAPALTGAIGVTGPAILWAGSGTTPVAHLPCTPVELRQSAWSDLFPSPHAVDLCTITSLPS